MIYLNNWPIMLVRDSVIFNIIEIIWLISKINRRKKIFKSFDIQFHSDKEEKSYWYLGQTNKNRVFIWKFEFCNGNDWMFALLYVNCKAISFIYCWLTSGDFDAKYTHINLRKRCKYESNALFGASMGLPFDYFFFSVVCLGIKQLLLYIFA